MIQTDAGGKGLAFDETSHAHDFAEWLQAMSGEGHIKEKKPETVWAQASSWFHL
ncbi:hypothetical protein [uncultured Cohaesibacter sp.]|uniref:hypothetical protein n=1 Tax=uncultured Cohaesibacter sp. TaxID=1002546 RepID=UPI0029C86359|nr:hypothetical protein [uncultured Cohaesibacter sp.]